MSPHRRIRQLSETHFEEIKVFEVSDADPITTDLGSIRRTDSLLGRSDLIPPETVLADSVDFLVEVEDDVSAIGEEDATLGIDARSGETIDFVEERWEVDDDSVADDAGGFFVEDSGGEEVEFVFFAFDDDCVSGIGSAGYAGADVVLLR